jgi:hypothetical protein
MKAVKIVAALAVGAGAVPALAQSSSVTTNGTTTIVEPVTIAQNSALSFGTIVRPISGSGTVTIGTGADTVSTTGGAIALSGTTSRARYTLTGEGGQIVSITMPASFNMSRSGATDLAVTLTRSPAGNATLSGTAGSTGTAALDIGGSFPISSTTVTGAYSGSFTVSVAYN